MTKLPSAPECNSHVSGAWNSLPTHKYGSRNQTGTCPTCSLQTKPNKPALAVPCTRRIGKKSPKVQGTDCALPSPPAPAALPGTAAPAQATPRLQDLHGMGRASREGRGPAAIPGAAGWLRKSHAWLTEPRRCLYITRCQEGGTGAVLWKGERAAARVCLGDLLWEIKLARKSAKWFSASMFHSTYEH